MGSVEAFAEKAKTISDALNMREYGEYFHTDRINSSAVCFHTYEQYQGWDIALSDHPLLIGSQGKCFRYESKSMVSLERLRDFTMREIICLGTEKMVTAFRKEVTRKINVFFDSIGLNFYIAAANDPFFLEEFSVQSAFQRIFGLKEEFIARINGFSNKLAVGSVNNHRDYLGKAFDIKSNGEYIHSGCAAFGIERCVYAFLNQYGLREEKWSSFVRDAIVGKY